MNTSKNLTKSCVRYSYMYVDRAATPPPPPHSSLPAEHT